MCGNIVDILTLIVNTILTTTLIVVTYKVGKRQNELQQKEILTKRYEELSQIYKCIWQMIVYIEAIYGNIDGATGKMLLKMDYLKLYDYYKKGLQDFDVKYNNVRWIIEKSNIICSEQIKANIKKFDENFRNIFKSIEFIKILGDKEDEIKNIREYCEEILKLKDDLLSDIKDEIDACQKL